MAKEINLKDVIREVPDFPKKGIGFKDITTLLKDRQAYKVAVDLLCERYRDKDVNAVVGIESRGFILAGAMAYKLGAGMIPARKAGKLPAETYQATYELEYGTDTLEIHRDALQKGQRVLLVDDLLATGGTARAVADLLRNFEVDILELAFLIELTFLNGRDQLREYDVFAMVKY